MGALDGQCEGAHARHLQQASRQRRIRIGQRGQRLPDHVGFRQVLVEVPEIPQRRAIRLRQDDIEADHHGAGIPHTVDKLCHDVSRPGPLADPGEAFFVDGDDDDRRLHERARRQGLVRVENHQAQALHQRAVLVAQPQGRDEQHRRNQQIEPALHAGPRIGTPSRATLSSGRCCGAARMRRIKGGELERISQSAMDAAQASGRLEGRHRGGAACGRRRGRCRGSRARRQCRRCRNRDRLRGFGAGTVDERARRRRLHDLAHGQRLADRDGRFRHAGAGAARSQGLCARRRREPKARRHVRLAESGRGPQHHRATERRRARPGRRHARRARGLRHTAVGRPDRAGTAACGGRSLSRLVCRAFDPARRARSREVSGEPPRLSRRRSAAGTAWRGRAGAAAQAREARRDIGAAAERGCTRFLRGRTRAQGRARHAGGRRLSRRGRSCRLSRAHPAGALDSLSRCRGCGCTRSDRGPNARTAAATLDR